MTAKPELLGASGSSGPAASSGLVRRLGLFSATTLVVGSTIGSGIFISPALMAGQVDASGWLLLLWVLAGMYSLLGALSYGVLCAKIPHAGGQYVFLRQAFDSRTGFLFGWTFFLVIQSGTNAAVAIAFAKFLGVFGLPIGESHVAFSVLGHAISTGQLVACGAVVLLTGINCLGVGHGAWVQNTSTLLKVGAMILLLIAGWIVLGRREELAPISFAARLGPAATGGLLGALGVALSKALFAYDAWNTVSFVAEETHAPERNLPAALALGTGLIMLLYVGLCGLYYGTLSPEQMVAGKEKLVAADVARNLFGPGAAKAVALAVLVSAFGCLNGLILSGGRVLFAMARDDLFFRSCAQVHPRYHTPAVALWVLGAWTMVLILTGGYDALLTYVTFASIGFNGLTVLGLLRLHRREPERWNLRKSLWGGLATPILYVIITFLFMVYIVVGDPASALKGAVLVLFGWPVFSYFGRRGRTRAVI